MADDLMESLFNDTN